MHYAGWLARRWDDPAFPRAFPWFQEPKYWEQHVLNLREQVAAMEELLGAGYFASLRTEGRAACAEWGSQSSSQLPTSTRWSMPMLSRARVTR